MIRPSLRIIIIQREDSQLKRPEKKFLLSHNNQNNNKDRILKAVREKVK